jgi:hypothetical protein
MTPHPTRPPEYGSPTWAALPDTDPAKMLAVLIAAECWRRYWTPEARTWRAETAERDIRRRLRALSADLSTALDWRAFATAHTSYAELEHRRAIPPPTVTAVCAEPGCQRVHQLPAHLIPRPGPWTPQCWPGQHTPTHSHPNTPGRDAA